MSDDERVPVEARRGEPVEPPLRVGGSSKSPGLQQQGPDAPHLALLLLEAVVQDLLPPVEPEREDLLRVVIADEKAVLGEGGEIRLGPGTVEIQANGTIMQGGRRVDRLLIVDFAPNAALTRLGNGAINGAAAPTPVASPSLTQGSLETSNVNAVIELGAMQRGFRAYEANTNAIRAADQTLGRLIDSTTA